jgi:hypothetical protein
MPPEGVVWHTMDRSFARVAPPPRRATAGQPPLPRLRSLPSVPGGAMGGVHAVIADARRQLEQARARQLPPDDPWRRKFESRQRQVAEERRQRGSLWEDVVAEMAALPAALPPPPHSPEGSGDSAPEGQPVAPLPPLDDAGTLTKVQCATLRLG